MAQVILDIETVGIDFETLDKISQDSLLKYADSEEKELEEKGKLGLYPLTAQIVAIGLLNPASDEGRVYFQVPDKEMKPNVKEKVELVPLKTEKEILTKFWETIKEYSRIITFNGRGFDCPFIVTRSAINKVKATKNLMPNRYNAKEHVDLFDQLSFFGAVRKKFSLHMWCKALGIKSPKEQGITGREIGDLFKNKRHTEIAEYCLKDLRATKALYLTWEKYINIT